MPGLTLVSALVTAALAVCGEDLLVGKQALTALRSAVTEFSRCRQDGPAEQVLQLLAEAGLGEEDLEQLRKVKERNLAQARADEGCERAIKELELAVRALTKDLTGGTVDLRPPRAQLLLRLDSEHEAARLTLGHSLIEGRWFPPDLALMERRRHEIDCQVFAARRLPLPLDLPASDHRLLRDLGLSGVVFRHGDLRIHTDWPEPRARRIFTECLRAAALSRYLREGVLSVPANVGSRNREIVLLSSRRQYLTALRHSLKAEGIDEARAEEAKEDSFYEDSRGFAVEFTVSELDAYASLTHSLGWSWRWQEHSGQVQPVLSVGHLNWLCLTYFGLTSSGVAPRQGTEFATRESQGAGSGTDLLRRQAQSVADAGIDGARTWMVFLAQNREDSPWASAFKDQMAFVTGNAKLKATFMVEYLQLTGQFGPLLRATVRQPGEVRIEDRMVAALGCSLETLEERWRSWILPPSRGLLQELRSDSPEHPPEARDAAAHLNRIRERVWDARSMGPFEPVIVDADLSRGAAAHCRYLDLHPEQKGRWPDLHEEYPDHEGFSVTGARAGWNAVIHFDVEATEAIDGWMATYFHRLPLLHPGLKRIGYAGEKDVVVLDCETMVDEYAHLVYIAWPPDGSTDIPTAFAPELPNPVPGEDQEQFGYPITWQVIGEENPFRLQLFQGTDRSGSPVPCHFSSPQRPLNVEVVPPGAYCLIPHAQLRSSTDYTVLATDDPGNEYEWSFRTR